MGYTRIVRRSLKAAGDVVLEATTAWADAVDEAAAGTLDTTSVLSKSMKVTQRWLLAVWCLIERGDPLLPVLYIEERANDVPGHSPSGTVYLEEPLGATVTLAATGPQLLGGTATLAVSPPIVVPQSGREEIKLSLAVPAASTVSAGLYQGLIHASGKLYATVTVRLT